jgi:hypothetical protein
MATKTGFWATAWRKVSPHALAAVIDIGNTLSLWVTILVMHIAHKVMEAAGIDSEFVGAVAFGEKWVFLATFAGLFWRILVREFRNVTDQEL